MEKLIAQLKRRQVFKVATIYAVSAWPLIQIADLAVPALGLPDSVLTLLLKIFIAGFPVSLMFAWLYNFTGRGIVRADEDDDQQSQPQVNLQTTVAVAGTLTLVLLLTLGLQLMMGDGDVIEIAKPVKTAEAEPTPPTLPDTTSDDRHSIAILPFVAFSSDQQDEYFADGMVEELLNLLAQIPELRVAARTSSFAYKGVSDKTIFQIGRELGVKTILEGSIRKNDTSNKIRVTAQLIDVDSGEHLWSETYDREYRDIFQIQDEIARSVVDKMQLTLLGQPDKQEFVPQTTSVDAMVAFGKGQKEMEHRTAESLGKALEQFQLAVQLDAHYARAYAAIADTYNLLRIYGHMPPNQAKEAATKAIDKALSLDDNLAEAYAARGLLFRESDEATAEQALQKAIELNPSYAPAYMWYGTLLEQRGQMTQAHQMKEKAFELDPKSPIAANLLAVSHYVMGNEAKAMELFSHIIAIDPYYPGAYTLIGDMLNKRGRLDESMQMYRRALDVDALNVSAVKGMLVASTDLGDYDKAEQWFDYIQRHNEMFEPYLLNLMKFRFYQAKGERDKAIDFLDHVEFAKVGSLPLNQMMQGYRAYLKGDYRQAVAQLEAIRNQPGAPEARFYQLEQGRLAAHLAYAYAQLEMTDKLHELLAGINGYLEDNKARTANNPNYYYTMALIKAIEHKPTEAFHYLQGAIDVGWVQVWQARSEPAFASLQNDIQFTVMLSSVDQKLAHMRERLAENENFMAAKSADAI